MSGIIDALIHMALAPMSICTLDNSVYIETRSKVNNNLIVLYYNYKNETLRSSHYNNNQPIPLNSASFYLVIPHIIISNEWLCRVCRIFRKKPFKI